MTDTPAEKPDQSKTAVLIDNEIIKGIDKLAMILGVRRAALVEGTLRKMIEVSNRMDLVKVMGGLQ